MPEPQDEPFRLVPCPHCGLEGNHTGVCPLSLMQSGEKWIVVAVKSGSTITEVVTYGA